MKALQWCEGEMPLYALEPAETEILLEEAGLWLGAADKVRSNLINALKQALFADGGRNAKADQTLLANASTAFWSHTESAFYSLAGRFAESLHQQDDAQQIALATLLRNEWAKTILATSDAIFSEQAASGAFDERKAPRIYGALNQMRRFNRGNCNKVLATGSTGDDK